MELRQLRYFVTLAEELHFGRAAAREHIVQSALSQQVQRLERELGVRLLERSTHHVALTAAGAAFLAEARQILGPGSGIQPVHRRDVPVSRVHPHRAPGHRGEHRRGRRSRRPGTLPVLRTLFVHLGAAGNDLATAHRAGLVLPVVRPVAGDRGLRPRTSHRELRANHVQSAGLAGHHQPGHRLMVRSAGRSRLGGPWCPGRR
ncbi:MAG TPA: LysR family transcriptional regulator [Streptosporangiaceae bacterium]|nr:LysR family transcriptional regulator [Streptosporangiaceae bacterium]